MSTPFSKKCLKTFSLCLLSIASTFFCWAALNFLFYFLDGIDERAPFVVLADEVARGETAVPFVCPRCMATGDFNPLLKGILPADLPALLGSVPRASNIYCQEDDGWYSYAADRYGFSNDDGAWNRKIDYLLVGDSFTQGACTPKNLRAYLSESGNVINLGMGGNGPLVEYAVLKEFFAKFAAKNVLWLVYVNDIAGSPSDFESEKSSPALARYLYDDKYTQDYFDVAKLERYRANMLGRIAPLLKANVWNIEAGREESGFWHSLLYGAFLKARFAKLKDAFGIHRRSRETRKEPWIFASADDQKAILSLYRRGAALVRKNGGRVTFVFVPSPNACLGIFDPNPYQFIKDFLMREKIDYMDFASGVSKDCSDYSRRRGYGHFNQEGYRKLASAIIAHLSNRK